jgi:hypothetical protein
MRATIVVVLFAAMLAPASAWDGHDKITAAAIESLTWLDEFSAVPVTPPTDKIVGIHPDYTFEFHGEQPGQTMTAREILARYSFEPDWGFDQNLNVSWQQKFMGGTTGFSSQAYFHMYYPRFTVHLPIPGIEMGAAPSRLELWARAARTAFERNDPYWGFRYLACAMHYIEDVAQPFHATQTSIHFLSLQHPIEGTTKITGNYHFVYEGWVREKIDGGRFGFLDALRGTDTVSYGSQPDYVKKVAKTSHRQSAKLLKACVDFFDRRFKQPKDVVATPADHAQLEPAEPRGRIVAATLPALKLTGQSIRGFLEAARPNIIRWMRRTR